MSALAVVAAGTAFVFARAWQQPGQERKMRTETQSSTEAQNWIATGLDSLRDALGSLQASSGAGSHDALVAEFRRARAVYKRYEVLVEAEGPSVAGELNGPLPEDDDGPPRPLAAPAAFQTIETIIFRDGALSAADRMTLQRTLAAMQKSVGALRELAPFFVLTDSHVSNALRRELARVSVLGLAGFDANASGDAIVESANAIHGMQSLASAMAERSAQRPLWTALADSLQRAAAQLRVDRNFFTMNRLRFLAVDVAAVARALNRVRANTTAIDSTLRLVWRSGSATVYERGAFDATAYAPAFAMRPTPALIALGARLFRDPMLSGPATRSCATCHVPELAFADGKPRHTAMGNQQRMLSRNTPTLLNIALHPNFFADGSAATLEDQIGMVLSSDLEMASSPALAARRLNAVPRYRDEFAQLVGTEADSGITAAAVRSMLATYVRSLVQLTSRFDAAVQGDTLALTAGERRGFTLFMGKAHCGTCHFAPLFSGVVPPAFAAFEPEIIGAPLHADTIGATVDSDPGRSAIDHIELHHYAFNVPTPAQQRAHRTVHAQWRLRDARAGCRFLQPWWWCRNRRRGANPDTVSRAAAALAR